MILRSITFDAEWGQWCRGRKRFAGRIVIIQKWVLLEIVEMAGDGKRTKLLDHG